MDDVKQLISDGVQLFKDGKLDEAIAKLKAAVEEDPSSVQAHSYLGAAYARNGENPASVEQFQAAVDLDPQSAVHTFNLGQAFETAGSKPRAQALYEKALALDPKYARAKQRRDALTGGPKPAPAPPAPAAPPAPTPPPAVTAAMPSAPQPAPTQMGSPYSPPGGQPQAGAPTPYGAQPQYGGATQYGAPPRYPDPALGLGMRGSTYANYSPSWKRFVASLIDGLVLAVVILPVYFLAVMPAMSSLTYGSAADPRAAAAAVSAAVTKIQGFAAVLGILYYVGFNGSLGATPGKLALGMRIVKTDGSKMGFGTTLGRYFLQGIFAALTCGGLSYIAILVNPQHRGWHDQLMDTMVVDK